MSEHATRAMLENIEQNLIELMADFLDSDSLKLDEMIALIKDPAPREESELHVRMANAAFNEYKKTVLSSTPAGEDVWQSLLDAYPLDIFPEIPQEQYLLINEMLKEKFGFPIDRLAGHIGRKLITGYKAALQNKVPVECYVETPENVTDYMLYYFDTEVHEWMPRANLMKTNLPVNDGWISVEDTLPDENQKVLVCKRTGHISIATYFPIDQFNREKMFVCIGGAYYDLTWIRYWMLLPTPPQTNPDQSKQ
jgi:hypothetical protein